MNISWKGLFDPGTRAGGQEYYRHGMVEIENEDVTEDGSYEIFASISGTQEFRMVTVVLTEGGLVESMACDCTFAQRGKNCRHMAAVLFRLERWNPSIPLKAKALLQRSGLAVRRREQEAERRRQEEEQRKKEAERRRQEEERRKKEAEEALARLKTVTPFQSGDGGADSYRFFDFAAITADTLILEKDWQESEKVLPSLQGGGIRYGFYANGTGGLLCQYEKGYEAGLVISQKQIESLRCGEYRCPGYMDGKYTPVPGQIRRKAFCPHALAMLRYMKNWIEQNEDRGDATDYAGQKLFRAFSTRLGKSEKAGEAGRPVSLHPTLLEESDRLSLTWKIGAGKMYAVKSLNDLVTAVEDRKPFPLGKKEELRFDADTFDERSAKFYQLIKDSVTENRQTTVRQRNRWFSETVSIPALKNELPLFGGRIDLFYDTAQGLSLEMVEKSAEGKKTHPLRLAEADPEARLRLNQMVDERGIFHGVRLWGRMPEMIPGGRFDYCLSVDEEGGLLARVSPEWAEKMKPLEDLVSGGEVDLRIGRNHLSEFYYTILPELRQLAEIEEPDADAIAPWMPPRPEFTIYLDAENKLPVARVAVTYGVEECSILDWQKPGFVRQPFRAYPAENRALELMRRYFQREDPARDLFLFNESEDLLLRLMDEGLREMTDFCEVRSTPAFDALRIRRMPQVQVGVSLSDGSLLDLKVDSGEVSREELLEILQSYRKKKSYHRLRSGSWVQLDEDTARLSAMLEALGVSAKEFVSGKMHIPAYRALYLDRMLEQSERLYATRDQRFRKLIKEFKTVGDSEFEPPAGLTGTLREYQVHGYKWLRTLATYGFGGILADDMGLGKTVQMIAVFLAEKEAGTEGTSLIVCPASLVYNWVEEMARFAPALRAAALGGGKSERTMMLENYRAYDVLVTSYDLLKRDILLYEGKSFLYQVLDEAQFVKTHSTAAAKSVRLVQALHRFALTGTPIENRLSELWSIFDFLMPGFLYPYETFRQKLETPIVKNQDEEAGRQLKRMVSPFVLRRLKGDVLKDLPDKLEEVRYVRFEGEQKRLYDAQVVRIRDFLEKRSDEDVNRSKIEILAELTRIRQICCDPSLLFEDYHAASAKREACLELIQSAMDGGHRILVFSQFTSMLRLLQQDLDEAGIDWYTITGETSKQDRMDLVRRFNEGSVPVFLISLKAGGTGLNLTGADTVIHYDPWWNMAAQNQATDRAHRIGQTRTVGVYKLIAKDSVEEKILKLQQSKQDLADEILSGGARGISALSKDELLALLG